MQASRELPPDGLNLLLAAHRPVDFRAALARMDGVDGRDIIVVGGLVAAVQALRRKQPLEIEPAILVQPTHAPGVWVAEQESARAWQPGWYRESFADYMSTASIVRSNILAAHPS